MNYNKAEFFASYGLFSQIPEYENKEIVFAGRSNVGKSTLINKIFNRKALARVSSVPGKTATINFYKLEDVYFVDLPGYGYAKVSKSEKERWSGLIEGYLNSDRKIELVFLLIDMRHAPSRDDIHMIQFMIDAGLPFVIIFTKADKLTNNQRKEMNKTFSQTIPQFEDIVSIPFSSQTFEGVEKVREIIDEVSSQTEDDENEDQDQ